MVEVKTAGYGEREIRESVVVHTNDPRNPVMELLVSGMVEKFADIRPKQVRLTGKVGEPVTAVAEIVPRPDHPFKIKNIRAMKGRHIQFSLANKAASGSTIYELTITSTRQDAGSISDVIYLDTDSPIRPTLQVTVSGTIIEARKETP
jgi:hypothetical protein